MVRFSEQRVTVLAGEAHHLILNGGAVARADTLDHAAVQRAALDIVQNDLVGCLLYTSYRTLWLSYKSQNGQRL